MSALTAEERAQLDSERDDLEALILQTTGRRL